MVPEGFLGVGEELVGGIDGEVDVVGQVGLVAGSFDVHGA